MSFGQQLYAIALPTLTLVLVVVGHMMRMTRAAVLNVLSSAYIETAELKGISPSRIIWKHALPNALAPIVNVVALNLAYLVVGVVVVEVIFVYPGMGQYMVDHVSKRDVPVVQACGLVFAARLHRPEPDRGPRRGARQSAAPASEVTAMLRRIPPSAIIGLAVLALYLFLALFAPLDRALSASPRWSARSGSRPPRSSCSAPTISAATSSRA